MPRKKAADNMSLRRKTTWTPPPRVPATPLARAPNYAPASNDVVSVPKEVILRSRPYRMWVATWPCDLCGWPETQAAHENGADKGKGLKVCDSRVFPLCVAHQGHMGHHYQFDNYIDISREEARELGAKLSAQMRARAIAAGWKFSPEGITR